MNRKNLTGFIIIILMVTSGPLFVPLVLASTQEVKNVTKEDELTLINTNPEDEYQYNTTDSQYNSAYNDTVYTSEHDKISTKNPSIKLISNIKEGESPLYVTFKTIIENLDDQSGILIVKYDFDGDGYNDYATYENKPVTHVYTVQNETTLHPAVTVVFKNALADKMLNSTDLLIFPINPDKWFSVKRFGYTRFAINKNGTLIIHDERDWIQVTPKKDGVSLKNPTYAYYDDFNSRLTFETDAATLHMDITYGLAGRAQLTFTETTKNDASVTETSILNLPTVKRGRLDFAPSSFDVLNKTTRSMTMDAGNHDPWQDQGVAPYGEYFKNENEYVSIQTGFLTVTQTDLYIPGRGLDLSIARVNTPPSYFYGNQPASTVDYSYQDYPWAPMGKGWQLAFPWIETKNGNPAYIRFPNGQRYKYDGAGTSGTEYHSGDHFKLYGYANGTYTLYTVDGARYNYNSNYRPTTIKDTCGNTISFTYNANNKIITITDTVGRTVSLSYNANGQVSSISSGNRTISYSYASGAVSGYVLTEVNDSEGRKTSYTYYLDYLVTKIEYPSGGNTAYVYNVYDSSGYYQYRVKKQIVYDGIGNYVQRYFIYDGGFDYVDGTIIRESLQTRSTVKTTSMTYSQNTVTEEVFDGEESNPRLYRDVKTLSEDHRRIDIDHFAGNNAYSVEMTQKYDNWGNLIFRRDYEGHDSYYSYSNTDSSGMFKDTNSQIYLFSDSFYSNNIQSNIHNLLLGAAEQQNMADSGHMEQYYQYSVNGLLTQTKRLLDCSWIKTSYSYDSYGNMVKMVNPENQTTYYEYGLEYNSAYLTGISEQLTDSKNITTSNTYYLSTGDLKKITDPIGSTKEYEYDILGRPTKLINPLINSQQSYKTVDYYDNVTYTSSTKKDTVTTGPYPTWLTTNTFNAEGRTWVFAYYSGYIEYYSSTDQDTWTAGTTVPGSANMDEWNLHFDGQYVHLALSTGSNSGYLYYCRGNPNSDGSITWGSLYSAYSTGSTVKSQRPSLTVTDNYVWICFDLVTSVYNKPYVTCSSNMDGGWSTRSGFPTLMATNYDDQCGRLTPLEGDKVYFVCWSPGDYTIVGWLWDGASWGSSESLEDEEGDGPFDISSWGNDVWFFQSDDSDGWAKVKKRTYSSGVWDSGTNIFIPTGSWAVQLARGPAYGTLYAWFLTVSNVYYSYFDGETWGSPTSLESDGQSSNSYTSLSVSKDTDEGKISVVYKGGASSPYNIRHNYLQTNKIASETSVKVTDENGNYVKRFSDGLGRLTRVERFNCTGSYSNETYSYNIFGLVENYTDPNGNKYIYEFDALGYLKKTIYPNDSYIQNNRNYGSYYDEIIDQEGRKKILKYDNMTRLIEVDEYNETSNYFITKYIYDEVGNLKSIVDSLDRETRYHYDQLNRLIQVDHPDDKWEAYNYDAVGNLINTIHRNGTCIQYQYDSLNRMVNETHYLTNITINPLMEGWLTGWGYRKSIEISGTTVGSQTNYQIMFNVYSGSGSDTSNRVYLDGKCQADFDDIRFTKSDGDTILDYWKGYCDANMAVFWVEVDAIPSSPGTITIYIYYGNATANSESSGSNTFIDFDDIESYSNGATLPFGDWVIQDVDHTVQVTTDEAWEGSKSIYGYDSGDGRNSFRWNITDKTSGSYRMHAAYYVVNYGDKYTKPLTPIESKRIINVEYTDGAIRYYDGSWHTITIGVSTDAWHTMEICFAVGGSTFDICLDGVWYYNYNQEHQSGSYYPYVIEILNGALAYTTKAYYDAYFVGRYADPEPQISGYGDEETPPEYDYSLYYIKKLQSVLFSYDDCSNRISSSYNDTDVYWVYDAMNRLAVETFNVSGSLYSVSYVYDNCSNVVSVTYPDSSNVLMTYDFGNRMTTVTGVAELSYTRADKVDSILYGNGVTTDYVYDNRNRPVNILTKHGLTVLQNLTYSYDDSSSVTGIYDGTNTETYGYDLLDRLTSSSGPWGSLSYTYDSVGNRLTRAVAGGSSVTYTYDNVNRISSATGMSFTWDDNGNLLTWDDGEDDWAYRYDSENRLINVQKNDVVSAKYKYDADGRRLRSWDAAAGTTDYVYNGLNIIDEVNGGFHEKHIYAGSLHLASNSSGTVEYYHVDHLGSTRLKTNSTGGIIYESNYEPYGPGIGESGSEEFRYTGKPEDSTGLYYYGARYYDPVTGRFVTRDSVFGDLSDPQSLNRYSYCRNNPHKYTDPDGRIYNVIVGAIAGGGFNLAFYFFELAVTGEKFDAKVALATTISGTLTGAVAGATLGLSIPVGAAGNVAVRAGINILSNIYGSALEEVIIKGPMITNDDLITAQEKGICEGVQDQTVDIIIDLATKKTKGTTIGTYVTAITSNAAFFGPLISNTLTLTRTVIDRWWEFPQNNYSYYSSTSQTSGEYD